MAIIGGLNLSAVKRLKQTWMQLPFKSLATLHEIENLMSPESNFMKYREIEARKEKEDGAIVPFLGKQCSSEKGYLR
jgi:hypothetical protein